MPTTYTHDLFGKLLYKELPDQVREVVRRHGNLYRIGLHGPDIFFYFMLHHGAVFSFGEKMHDECADEFLEKGMNLYRKTGNEEILAYVLGFGAHYLLDSTCHPYVNEMSRKGIVSHTLLEKEYDRHLMIRTGRDPFVCRPSDCIVPKHRYAWVIHQVIPEMSPHTIYLSLVHMKWITNSMLPDRLDLKKSIIRAAGKLLNSPGILDSADHFMTSRKPDRYEEQMSELDRLFEKALYEAPAYIEELFRLSQNEGTLSERWERNYSGLPG